MANPTKSILWISPNHRWQIERVPCGHRFLVRVVSDDHADYPILITSDRGRVANLIWDAPDLVPAYVKRHADRILIPLLQSTGWRIGGLV